ncbi:hypothetical protein [Methylobacterium sp. D54C]
MDPDQADLLDRAQDVLDVAAGVAELGRDQRDVVRILWFRPNPGAEVAFLVP